MATHADVGLSQPAASTITMKLGTVTLTRNSTVQHQELYTVADAETTNALARVLAGPAAPASTEFGLVTRTAAYVSDRDQSSAVAAVLGAAPVSTTYGLAVRPVGGGVYYTHDAAVTVSTVAGPACMFRGTSTMPPAASTSDDAVWGTADLRGRQLMSLASVFPSLLSTTVLITSTHSTAVYEVVSSAASVQHRVFAFSVGSTHTNPSTLVFMSSLAIDRWHVPFGSGSSGMTGGHLAVTPPGFIFQTVAANALNVRIEGGSSVTSTVVARISIGYFTE